ncbi:hypothetical protein N2603_39625 [Bradyrhizobium huanghuaihaiense]|uniref:hypothetical protein n=1 Tax=Bradyrhizobium huanghuaihaiense TaxID=990078 RepID=UPI0021AA43C9|nr:hypothetical protein [Bradyrhizobium sp. CB3035]UWU75975.1 hypothetical protein N2603_39625 [Bradyrhizobium sp. CB3035]
MKVELNDVRSGKGGKTLVSSPLICLDGTWWAIDVNDPDLEAHLKQSARCGGVLAAVRERKTINGPELPRKGRQHRSAQNRGGRGAEARCGRDRATGVDDDLRRAPRELGEQSR